MFRHAMRTNRPYNLLKHAAEKFPKSTLPVSSSDSGNYEGDTTLFWPPAKRRINFSPNTEDEYSDTSIETFTIKSPKALECRKGRFSLCELLPNTSNRILSSFAYNKLVQLVTDIIFVVALVTLCSFQVLKNTLLILVARKSHLCEWKWSNLLAIIATTAAGYCYLNNCQATCTKSQ